MALVNTNALDSQTRTAPTRNSNVTQKMRTGSQETPETRTRSAETDAERPEEEATSAEADSVRSLALKRKAEGELDDSGNPEVEDSVMNSLAKSWHRENPDDEVDLLILQQRDNYVASVHETSGDKPVCEEPKTPFPDDECIDDTSGKLLNNTLVEKARAEEISVIRERGVWEVVDRPCDEVVFGTRGSTSQGDETKPFYRSRLVVREFQASSWLVILHSHSSTRGTAKFVDLCNN